MYFPSSFARSLKIVEVALLDVVLTALLQVKSKGGSIFCLVCDVPLPVFVSLLLVSSSVTQQPGLDFTRQYKKGLRTRKASPDGCLTLASPAVIALRLPWLRKSSIGVIVSQLSP